MQRRWGQWRGPKIPELAPSVGIVGVGIVGVGIVGIVSIAGAAGAGAARWPAELRSAFTPMLQVLAVAYVCTGICRLQDYLQRSLPGCMAGTMQAKTAALQSGRKTLLSKNRHCL